MASLKRLTEESVQYLWWSIAVLVVCRRDDFFIKRLTKLLTLDEMLWYIIILINTNDSSPKLWTVEFLCAVLRFLTCHLIL